MIDSEQFNQTVSGLFGHTIYKTTISQTDQNLIFCCYKNIGLLEINLHFCGMENKEPENGHSSEEGIEIEMLTKENKCFFFQYVFSFLSTEIIS